MTERLKNAARKLEAQNKYSGVVFITREGTPLYTGAFGYASRPWKINCVMF